MLRGNINVQSQDSSSMQATVFFGREASLGIRVVLKQYRNDLRGIFREIKIFTELERLKKKQHRDDLAQILKDGPAHNEALPHLLSYAVGKNNSVGEVLMTNGGQNLAYW